MFSFQWKMSLVIFCFITVLIITGLLRSKFKTKLAQKADFLRKKTGGMIEESIINIRTVCAFNMQDILIQKY
jgi:hypothetical protein